MNNARVLILTMIAYILITGCQVVHSGLTQLENAGVLVKPAKNEHFNGEYQVKGATVDDAYVVLKRAVGFHNKSEAGTTIRQMDEFRYIHDTVPGVTYRMRESFYVKRNQVCEVDVEIEKRKNKTFILWKTYGNELCVVKQQQIKNAVKKLS